MSIAGIFLLVLLISSLSILLLTPFAERFKLVDVPDSQRKFHPERTPLIGGMSIYAGLVMGISLFVTPNASFLTYLLCSSVLVALGVADDVRGLSPYFRLLVQSLVAVFMCAGSGMYIHSLGDIFGLGVVDLGVVGYAVTVLAVIAAINAFNMIDGIDGLLGISSLITFAGMGILFSLNHDADNMKLALIISVALVPYLMANLGFTAVTAVRFKKIFMGDTGSMLIGFTVVWLLIQGTHAGDGETASFSAATALWLIAFPLMDMVRVMGDRVRRGKSLFYPDRSHLHHILQDTCGDSKRTALLKICTLSAFFAVAGILMHVNAVREVIMFSVFLVGFVAYTLKVNQLNKKFSQ